MLNFDDYDLEDYDDNEPYKNEQQEADILEKKLRDLFHMMDN